MCSRLIEPAAPTPVLRNWSSLNDRIGSSEHQGAARKHQAPKAESAKVGNVAALKSSRYQPSEPKPLGDTTIDAFPEE